MNQEQSQVATVYTVKEISTMLKLSIRKAYDLCNTTADFKVIRIGRCLRVVNNPLMIGLTAVLTAKSANIKSVQQASHRIFRGSLACRL